MNTSIKDMNQAFKDQVSRIKEIQEDSISFTSEDYMKLANQQHPDTTNED